MQFLWLMPFSNPRLFLTRRGAQDCAGDYRCLDAEAERLGSSAITPDYRAVYTGHHHDCAK